METIQPDISVSSAPRGRGPARQEEIVGLLRQQIVTGELAPGSRLPTRRELSTAYVASTRTVQDALDVLAADGFVNAYGTRGTFVSNRPPHLSNYAFVFNAGLETNRFWSALNNEALRRRREQVQQIDLWHHIDGHADNEDYQRLVDQVRRHRVAGLIFTTSPFGLQHTPLLDEPNIARVAVTRQSKWPHVSTVSPDDLSFRRRALDDLASRGCKRLALILPEGFDDKIIAEWHADASERGMDWRPYWTVSIPPKSGNSARNIAHLLFNPLQRELPDGLIIADDNFVEPATAGLLNAGIAVGRDLHVVTHCNFPWPTPSVVPVRRLGFSAVAVVDACIRSIDQQLRDPTAITKVLIPAVFEDEISD